MAVAKGLIQKEVHALAVRGGRYGVRWSMAEAVVSTLFTSSLVRERPDKFPGNGTSDTRNVISSSLVHRLG